MTDDDAKDWARDATIGVASDEEEIALRAVILRLFERLYAVEQERDALRAQLAARSEDAPDITIGAAPWTDKQLADMRASAALADLRHARELVEASGLVVSEPDNYQLVAPPTYGCTCRSSYSCPLHTWTVPGRGAVE